MTPQRFREIRLLFEEIISLSPAQRCSALMEASLTDRELADEVEALIAAYSEGASFIESPVIPFPRRHDLPTRPGSIIGAYELLELVGIGGMGEVGVRSRSTPSAGLLP